MMEANSVPGGQLFSIHNSIIDYPGLVTRNGAEFREALLSHVKQLDCDLALDARVTSINPQTLEIEFMSKGNRVSLQAESVILATGVTPRRLMIPGEQEMMDRGEMLSASKDAARFAGKIVAVIGGGDRAFEGALLFSNYCRQVYLVHRSDHFRARHEYIAEASARSNIAILQGYVLENIEGSTRVESISLRNVATNRPELIHVDAVLLRVGVQPQIELVKGLLETDAEGYIVTDSYGQTNIPGIFAIGDLCNPPLVSSLAHAASQGMVAVKYIQAHLLSR
jgi:thioredoxin reductase (NADPH)